MNKEEIIENMIQYIEEEERNLQAARMSNDIKILSEMQIVELTIMENLHAKLLKMQENKWLQFFA